MRNCRDQLIAKNKMSGIHLTMDTGSSLPGAQVQTCVHHNFFKVSKVLTQGRYQQCHNHKDGYFI